MINLLFIISMTGRIAKSIQCHKIVKRYSSQFPRGSGDIFRELVGSDRESKPKDFQDIQDVEDIQDSIYNHQTESSVCLSPLLDK